MKVKWCWGGVLIFLIFARGASADKILMENGDRFRGSMKMVEGDVLTFSTDYSETIQLKTSQIKKVYIQKPAKIHLNNGKIIRGRILPWKPGHIKVASLRGRGYALLDWSQIKSINPPPQKWTGSFSFGGSRDSGNTDRLSASLGGELKKRFKNNKFEFEFLSNYSEEDDKVTARNTYGSSQYSHYYKKKWYGYLSLDLLTDTFRDLLLKTTIGPGLGYQVWDDNIKTWSLEGGFSYIIENRKEGRDEKNANARLGTKFRYQIFQQLSFSNNFVVFPSLEERGEFTLRNQASLRTDLGKGWILSLSNILDRDSKPAPNVKQNDVHWILALGYSF